jgi:ribonuclease-3
MGLNNFILLSKGESKDTGRARHSILADVMESVIGAIYLDKGYEVTDKFILENISPLIVDIIKNKSWIDAKSMFQEKSQEVEGVTPHYDTLDEVGPDHDKVFVVGLHIGEELVSKGEGKSKQEAAQDAAAKGLIARDWS